MSDRVEKCRLATTLVSLMGRELFEHRSALLKMCWGSIGDASKLSARKNWARLLSVSLLESMSEAPVKPKTMLSLYGMLLRSKNSEDKVLTNRCLDTLLPCLREQLPSGVHLEDEGASPRGA